MGDSLVISGQTFHNVAGIKATDTSNNIKTYTSGAGAAKVRKDVNFYDYDGTIAESYTTAEFADISALPANPTHEGLTAQGWNMPSNWTLADAKTYISTNKKADWGQMYTTTSGKTEIDVEFTDPNRLSPNMSLAVNGEVSIDWGDGSSAETVTGNSLTTRVSAGPHTYSAIGKYTIKVTSVSGSWGFLGSSTYTLLHKNSSASYNRVYANCARSVRIGAGCTIIGAYAFYYCGLLTNISISSTVTIVNEYSFNCCYNLISITIPSGVTKIGNNAFSYCYNLTSITIPNTVTNISNSFQYCEALKNIIIPSSVTSMGTYTFRACYNLTSITIQSGVTSIGDYMVQNCSTLTDITIPSTVTSIGSNAFEYCYALSSITIPSGVTSIGSNAFSTCSCITSITIPSSVTSIATKAFQSCYGLGAIHFERTTPPVVDASDAFSNLPTDCKIYVPTGYLTAYTTASNYPDSSTYTYIEE